MRLTSGVCRVAELQMGKQVAGFCYTNHRFAEYQGGFNYVSEVV